MNCAESSKNINEMIWDHFSTNMVKKGLNPLKQTFNPYLWYTTSMDKDSRIESIMIKYLENQKIPKNGLNIPFLININAEIINEINQLIELNNGTDVIYEHFKKTMIKKGKNPLSVNYNQINWYINHMKKNETQ